MSCSRGITVSSRWAFTCVTFYTLFISIRRYGAGASTEASSLRLLLHCSSLFATECCIFVFPYLWHVLFTLPLVHTQPFHPVGHALRRNTITGYLWQALHLPFLCCLLIFGVSLKVMLYLDDAPLTDYYAWMMSGPLAAGLVLLSLIKQSHTGFFQCIKHQQDVVRDR